MNTQLNITQFGITQTAINEADTILRPTLAQSIADEAAAHAQRESFAHDISSAIIAYGNQSFNGFTGHFDAAEDSVKLGVQCQVTGCGDKGMLRIKFSDLSEQSDPDTIYDVIIPFTTVNNFHVVLCWATTQVSHFKVSHRGTDCPIEMVKLVQQSMTVINMVIQSLLNTSHDLFHTVTINAKNALNAINQARAVVKARDKVFDRLTTRISEALKSEFDTKQAQDMLNNLTTRERQRAKLMLPRVTVDEDGIYIELTSVLASVCTSDGIVIQMAKKGEKQKFDMETPNGRAGFHVMTHDALCFNKQLDPSSKGDFSGVYFLPSGQLVPVVRSSRP